MVADSGDASNSPRSSPLATEIREVLAALRDEVRTLREEVQTLRDGQDGDDALLSREEAADRLGISTRLLDDLAEQDEIEPVRISGRVLYEPSAIEEYIRTQAGGDGRRE